MAAASSRRIAAARLGVYETLHELASGGMATVSIARHAGAGGFERLVVIKRVHPHLLKDRAFSDMFRDEARVCSTIRHPNVVPVIDVVESAGELYLVLEYVESLSLAALLRAAAGERLPAAIASRILSDALAGLHAAHEAVDMRGNPLGLIHRDVSPQNIVVGLDGSSRLIDFGIAKAASRITSTESGVLKGKLRYMAPEQVQRKPLDRRADVFAAGEILYEALTGHRAFPGDDTGDIVVGLLIGGVEPPTVLAPELPVAIDAVLEKALARSRDERFATAVALQEALEHAIPPAPARDVAAVVERLGGARLRERREALREALHAGAAAGPAMPVARDDATLAAPAPAPELAAPPPRRRGWLVAAALVVVTAGVAAVGLRFRAPSRPTATAAIPDEVPATSAVVPSVSVPVPSVSATESASAAVSAPPPRIAPPVRPRPNPSPELHRRNPYGSR